MLCLLAGITVFAQKDLNSSQLKLRTDIFNFLKEEGFMPEIDKDGDIKFKRQGNFCFVIISETNTSPMYARMERYISVPEQYSEMTSRLAAEQLSRRFKAIKCCYMASSNTLKMSAEMFLRSSEPFKEVFYQLCSSMDDLKDEIGNALEEEANDLPDNNKSVNIPLSISKIEIGNVYNDGKVETKYGATLHDDNTMYLKPRITYTGNKSGKVTLKVKFFNADGELSTSSKSPSGFSYEQSVSIEKGSGKTIELNGWGGEDKGHWKAGNYRLEVWYEKTCLKRCEFEVEESKDSSMQLLLDLMAEGMKEAYGGVPATVSVGKFNIEIHDIETDVKSTSLIMVFRMPKKKSAVSDDEQSQALTFCNSGTKAATDELRKNPDLKDLGLENITVVYRLEDKYGTYIAGEKK